VSAKRILPDYECKRIIDVRGFEPWLYSGITAGPVTVATVQNLVLVQGDGIAQAVHPNVGYESAEGVAIHQREDVRERVKWMAGLWIRVHRLFQGGYVLSLCQNIRPWGVRGYCARIEKAYIQVSV
jgi:hypothetical protein